MIISLNSLLLKETFLYRRISVYYAFLFIMRTNKTNMFKQYS
jgi:hypothetical protein